MSKIFYAEGMTMRRLWAWILTAALLLGIAAPAGAWMSAEDVYAAYIAAKDNIQGITIRTPTVKVGESAGIMITLKDGTNVQNISAKISYSSATSSGRPRAPSWSKIHIR